MDKISNLILLTDQYPYGNGETFIENEIGFLSANFSKVIIVPLEPLNKETIREIPANVSVSMVPANSGIFKSVNLAMFFQKYVFKEFLFNLFSNPLKNKVLTKSIMNGNKIKNHLENVSKKFEGTEIIYYSYWLNDAAIGLSLLNSPHKKISRAHRWEIFLEDKLYGYMPLRKFLACRLHKIFAISAHGMNELVRQTGSGKIALSRLGTINDDLIPESSSFRKNEPILLLSIGAAIPRKRLHLVGEAVDLLGTEKINWVHFGGGPLLTQLKDLYPEAKFAGWMPNRQLKAELRKFSTDNSILLNTSANEGIPVSIMEAMSYGIPCIAPDVGGIAEIVENGENGYLLPAEPNAPEIANILQHYAGLSAESKSKLRINARNTWEQKYNAMKNYPEFIQNLFDL